MDPSSWVNYTAQHYSRLRASGNQMNQLNVPPGLNVGQSGHQLNVNDHLGIGMSTNATNQAMSGHYGSSAAHPHSWFFSSHGLNAASHQTPTHESSSFNANPFLHHPGYDSSFLSAQFQSKASYLPSAAVGTGFFNPMKKADNDMNNLRNAAYCSTMSGMTAANINNNMGADPNNSLTTGSLFPSHLAAQSWRHHPNLMASNTSSGPFGILPHEAVNSVNVMPSGSNQIGGAHSSHASHPSHPTHSSHASHSSHNSSHHSSSSHSKSANESTKGHHFHHHHKTSAAMPGMSSVDNSFRNIIPTLPPTQSTHAIPNRNQTSFDPSVGAKITSHHHHSQTDPYASGMFAMAAAAHAIGSDYASMQTQRYASGMTSGNQQAMTAFASNTASRSTYPSVPFNSDPSARSRELLTSSSLLQSSKQGSNNTCNARNMSAMNAMNAMNGTYLSNCAMMPMMNTGSQSVANYSSSPAHSINNVISNSLAANQSVSRSSSSASNHGLQQGNDSSCSFGYGSPATNLPQSPYPQPQRSNTSNSSQGTPTATGAAVQSSTQEYSNYGTPQGFPTLGNQTPTPTPGYPTPPSSVGQPHVTPSNSQASTQSHEEQVSHYPQLTPQTPTQSTPFASNYTTNFGPNTKMPPNSRPPETLLTNTSSCMVAAAAANLNNSQNNASVVSQRPPSGYALMSGATIHEPEPESCGLSSMVGVNPMSDSISNAKLSDSQINSGNHVIGHQSEPTLNSVFSSQEIDFPIINFPVNEETNNGFNPNLKPEQNSFTGNKKKSKNNKKNRKRDKNKNNGVNVGLSVDPNNTFSNYEYPTQQTYQNSYPNPNPYLMTQNISHHNQTSQDSQQTHNLIPNDSSGTDAHTNANSCYDMQYQQIAEQQVPTQQTQTQQQTQQHTTQPEHDLMHQLPPHEPIHPSVQTQEHQLIEPVLSMASQQLTQSQTTSVTEKQSFPTIDDELSFLTEPTDCVSMETQTPNISGSVQMETQSPLVINQSSNICSDRQNANLSPNSNANNNSNSNQGNNSSSQPSGFLKSFMSFINSPTGAPAVPKEKKKKKLKESNENKVKQNNNTVNGQKSNKSKKAKLEDNYDFNSDEKYNFSSISQNTQKLMSGENVGNKKSNTGDRENYESKFFKRRPSTNINTNSVHIIEMESRKDVKNGKKHKQNKMNFSLFANESHQTHDEYEFPDSPPNTQSFKKSRKSSTSDNSCKKRTAPDFEKIISPSINFKKNNNKKTTVVPNPSKPLLPTSSLESIENSINLVALNSGLTKTGDSPPVLSIEQNSYLETTIKTEIDLNDSNLKNPNNCVSNQINNCEQNKKQIQNQIINKKSPNVKTSPTLTTTLATPISTTTVAIDQILSPIQMTPISTIPMTTTSMTTTTITTVSNNLNVSTTPINNNLNSVGMQSAGTNTPRRRSQDKKASTIREGLMRTGDFVVSMDESQYDLPVIWRIEGKSLLQRFEPTEQEDITVYINTSSYSAWNPTVRQRYTGVDVRIMGCSRTRIVVEKLGLTQNNPNALNGLTTIDRVNANRTNASQSSNSYQHQENFEVFIQTLISQALDPNFISEIVKENDEYFLSHVQAIDDVCCRKKSRFFSKVKWDANIVKCVETYPLFTVTAQNNSGDLRCRLCHDNWSSQILQFNGEPYSQLTLESQTGVDLKQTKYAACDPCTEKIVLYSHLHHQKYNFFSKCKSKVENMRGGDENKESHVILELCLQDSEWINTLFKELEEIWMSCDEFR